MATISQIRQRKVVRALEAKRDVLIIKIADSREALKSVRVHLKDARGKKV